MKRVPLGLLVVLLAACTNYSDRVQPYLEALPPIQLTALKGQDVTLDLRDAHGLPIAQGFLHEDLERSLTRAGVNVTARSPLSLQVTHHYLDTQYRLGRWQSCGRLEGQLQRDGKAATRAFTSDYCEQTTANPWENAVTQRSAGSEYESRGRAYFGLLRTFLIDLETNAQTL